MFGCSLTFFLSLNEPRHTPDSGGVESRREQGGRKGNFWVIQVSRVAARPIFFPPALVFPSSPPPHSLLAGRGSQKRRVLRTVTRCTRARWARLNF